MHERLESLKKMQHVKFRPAEAGVGAGLKKTSGLRTLRRKQ
jgi:hypothetical protein